MGVPADCGAIVRSIYDAALDERAWNALPRMLAEDLEGESAVLWCADGGALPEFACFNHSPSTLNDYAEHFRLVDPWTEVVMGHGLISTAFRGADLVADRTLVQSEFYYDFLRKADILPNIGAHLRLGPSGIGAIGIHRPVTASPFKDRHKQRLQIVIGHLEQMLNLRRHLRAVHAGSELTAAALHMLSAGIMICDAQARLLFVNAAAEALAVEHGGIALPPLGQAITTSRPEQSTQLRQMIAAAAHGEPGGALCLCDEAGDRLLLVVSPLPTVLDDAAGRALIAMRSEVSVAGPLAGMLIALFGLTVAEADLAWSLMQNQPLHAIRARRGVSENTIRTQLAHVFGKTGTANQRELVRLLSLVPTAFEAEAQTVFAKPDSP